MLFILHSNFAFRRRYDNELKDGQLVSSDISNKKAAQLLHTNV